MHSSSERNILNTLSDVGKRRSPQRVKSGKLTEETFADPNRLAELLKRVADLEQSLAESERLRAEESRYKTIFETVPVGVALTRPSDCSFVEFNGAAARELGYTREEFARLTIRDLEVPAARRREIAGPDSPAVFETRMRAKNGDLRDVIVSNYPLEIEGEIVICGISQDVTERKRAEEVLRQQLYIIETITSTTVDAIFMIDADLRLAFVNPAGERMFGFSFDELRGKRLHEMVHHKSADYSAREPVYDRRDLFFRKDGTPVYVSVSSAPLIRQGQIVSTVMIIRDVTDAELAGRELIETNQRLEAALAAAELGTWRVNFETGEHAWDNRMKSLFGLAPSEQVTYEEGLAFVHPEDLGVPERLFGLPPEPDGDIQWEWRVIPRGAGVRWHHVRARIIRDTSGRAVSAHGVTGDITDQKHAQEVREWFAAIVESSEDSISSATITGSITSWNKGAQAIFGYAPEEIIGCLATRLIPPERAGEMQMFLERLARGESVEHFETERLTKHGRRIMVSITLSPMRNESGAVVGVSTVTRDITCQKLLEEKLRQAEKMEAIGQLAGGIAHDFNNLLTIINGYAAMALMNDDEDSLREQLKAIGAAGKRATELTYQLLAFSRKQMLQARVMNVNDVVEGMNPLLRRMIREDIECEIALCRALPDVEADPHQIEQVLLNLVVNACDAMGSGGRLRIETDVAVLDEEYARMHPDVVPGTHVVLSVSDTGTGIDPNIRAHIFEPFFTTKPVGKGTGLGLSMVYGIVRQSGGHVACSSEPGLGATFRVYLPRVYLPVAAAQSVQQQGVEK
jgi:two-component system, cell cycle sensor histidine kinase and response regulator CckA